MGIHGRSSNIKQTRLQRNFKKITRRKRQERKKKNPKKPGDVDAKDVGLLTKHHLKMRKSDPSANLRMSGKQRSRQMKKVRRVEKAKLKMAVEQMEVEDKVETKKTKKKT